jgi:hypothetical protein
MSKRYDAALKAMLEVAPADWPRLAGFPTERAEVIDADVSTVTAATDKVIRLRGPAGGIMHFVSRRVDCGQPWTCCWDRATSRCSSSNYCGECKV